MSHENASALIEAESLQNRFSRRAASRKAELLRILDGSRLPDASAVERLHELLCYWRAFPDDAEVLALVEGMLERFHERRDLRRHRIELVDTGIAGTRLDFRFYWQTALWMRRQGWDRGLTIHWSDFESKSKLVEMLHLLLPYTETPAIDSLAYSPREWVSRLKAPEESDASFVIRRFESMRDPASLEYLYETLDIPMRLTLGPENTARGRERWAPAKVHFQVRPPLRSRPSLRRSVREERFEVRRLSPARGQELIDLANAAMVSRHRDLLIFLYADPRDVSLVDFGDGIQFACMGARPKRRLMFEAVYGFLTLRNGVPIGYVLCSALYGSSEVAYNVFPTFRGSEAARIYGRVLAMVHGLFGVDCFSIDPYQLGHGNREGLLSGAWWFYYKLGFRPDDPEIRSLVQRELKRMKARPGYRSDVATLDRLSADYLYFPLGRSRSDVMGRLPLGQIGMRVSRYLAERFGADREAGLRRCSKAAAARLGLRGLRLDAGERVAWNRWAPLVMVLPGVERWKASEKRALFEVIRAKGGRRESDFVLKFDAHRKLRRALLKLAD